MIFGTCGVCEEAIPGADQDAIAAAYSDHHEQQHPGGPMLLIFGDDGPVDEATVALASIRARRDGLLASCDWTQASDSPLDSATKSAWVTYRQELRDFPDQAGFDPLNPPPWPTAPA